MSKKQDRIDNKFGNLCRQLEEKEIHISSYIDWGVGIGEIQLQEFGVKKNAAPETGTNYLNEILIFADQYDLGVRAEIACKGSQFGGPEYKKTSSTARLKRFYFGLDFEEDELGDMIY
jgi:hypothetical protein